MTDRELEISAYVDGELKPEQVRKIERDIGRDPQAAKSAGFTGRSRRSCAPLAPRASTREQRPGCTERVERFAWYSGYDNMAA